MLLVGVVARTQGNQGRGHRQPETDFVDERFAQGAVCGRRPAPDGPVATLAGGRGSGCTTGDRWWRSKASTSIDEAERFAGWELRVPADTTRELPAGTCTTITS